MSHLVFIFIFLAIVISSAVILLVFGMPFLSVQTDPAPTSASWQSNIIYHISNKTAQAQLSCLPLSS
jgi:energy-converting hydrogenase Eha subunit A